MVLEKKLTSGEISMKLVELIGLGERQRDVYDCLKRRGQLKGRALKAYQNHQKEMDLLKKYYKSYNNRHAKITT